MIELRGFVERDIEAIVEQLNNYSVSKFLSSKIPFPYTRSDAEWWVTVGCKSGITKAIYLNDTFVGVVGATPGENENSRSAEIGYWLGESFWGQGIATIAASQLTEIIFSCTNIVRLFAYVFSPNKASMRVLEKCGYELEGRLKKAVFKDGVLYDKYVYAKIHP
jgi:ribosomal-protein-alanine N-acetyltransferase